MLNACPRQKDGERATSHKVMGLYRFLSKRL